MIPQSKESICISDDSAQKHQVGTTDITRRIKLIMSARLSSTQYQIKTEICKGCGNNTISSATVSNSIQTCILLAGAP